jgi:dienelactone hydrolase
MPGPRLPPEHSRQALTGQGGYHVYTDNANVDRKGNDISTVEESLQDRTVDGFRLAYDRRGRGPGAPVVLLLHGWPGDRTDYREVVPLVSATADVVAPDLRGFG